MNSRQRALTAPVPCESPSDPEGQPSTNHHHPDTVCHRLVHCFENRPTTIPRRAIPKEPGATTSFLLYGGEERWVCPSHRPPSPWSPKWEAELPRAVFPSWPPGS